MKKKIAVKWVEALRSGDYKQGTGQLRDHDNNFCCLGVLCNIHAQEFPDAAAINSSEDEYFGDSALLPVEVMHWANMDSEDAGHLSELVIEGAEFGSLADANDSGADFLQIAAWIEKNYKKL